MIAIVANTISVVHVPRFIRFLPLPFCRKYYLPRPAREPELIGIPHGSAQVGGRAVPDHHGHVDLGWGQRDPLVEGVRAVVDRGQNQPIGDLGVGDVVPLRHAALRAGLLENLLERRVGDGCRIPPLVSVVAGAALDPQPAQPDELGCVGRNRRDPGAGNVVAHHLTRQVRHVVAHHVGCQDRPHRLTELETHPVDPLWVDALLHHQAGLHPAERRYAIRQKTGHIGDQDRGLADQPRRGDGGHQRLHIGDRGAADLHQETVGNRMEEVMTDHLLRSPGGGGHVGNRQRRGVRRQDGAGGTDRVELGEHQLFELDRLGHRLNHQIEVVESLKAEGRRDPVDGRRNLLGWRRRWPDRRGGELTNGGGRTIENLLVHVLEQYLAAGGGVGVGDARPHGAGAHDPDPPYRQRLDALVGHPRYLAGSTRTTEDMEQVFEDLVPAERWDGPPK